MLIKVSYRLESVWNPSVSPQLCQAETKAWKLVQILTEN